MGIGSVKGIEIHDCRKKDFSHTNQDINWDMSLHNYDLCNEQNINFTKAVKERIEELDLPKAVRKDAVVMAQVLVTSDNGFFKGLDKEQQEQFFKDSYNFLSERYGRENVISATVHLDESTPHMHFNFVPVTSDGRLSAKSLLTRQSLIDQQTAFYENVGKKHGLERGLEGGKKKHFEIAELKLETINKKVKETTLNYNSIKKTLNKTIVEINKNNIEILNQGEVIKFNSQELSKQKIKIENNLKTINQQVKAFENDKINFQKDRDSFEFERELYVNTKMVNSKEIEQQKIIIDDNANKINQQIDMLNKNHLINLKQKKDIKSQKIELDELTIKAESKMNDFNAITKDYNERSEIIKNNYEKANIVLDKQAAEIKNRTERIAALKETEKAQQETFDFNSKRITEQTEKIRKNKEIISKQIEGFNKTNEIFTKNKEVIKNQSLKIENQAIEIKKGEHAIESMRAIGKSVRDDLERTVSDFNNQDKQVLNRAVEFIKTLPSEIQERWSRFNVERKRTPSAWAKKLANEKKNGLER